MAIAGEAIGLIETRGLVCHIIATDAMCKAADVELVSQVQIGGAYITTIVRGDVGSVRAAVDAGAQVASQAGELISAHIIPRPEKSIVGSFRLILVGNAGGVKKRGLQVTQGRGAMKVLVVNIGSTSFKYRLYDMPGETLIARGGVERIGEEKSRSYVVLGDRTEERMAPVPDHGAALAACIQQLTDPSSGCLKEASEIAAIGFKAVHAGDISGAPIVDERVLSAMENYSIVARLTILPIFERCGS